jgi:HEAT repeat protein
MMNLLRTFKVRTLGLFLLGIAGLILTNSIVDASKAEDAKKFTEQLKTSKDAKKKVEALQELGKLGQVMKSLVADAAPLIVKALEDKDTSIRAAAATAYGKIDPDPKEAVPALVKLLKDDQEAVKIGALYGLAAMGQNAKEARSAVKAVMEDAGKKGDLAKAAKAAQQSIGGKKN